MPAEDQHFLMPRGPSADQGCQELSYLAGRGCSSGGFLSAMSSNMVIVFQRSDEEPQAFPLGKPGGNISTAWGEPTRRAAIWKVVASPNGNVYVMERKTASYL